MQGSETGGGGVGGGGGVLTALLPTQGTSPGQMPESEECRLASRACNISHVLLEERQAPSASLI